MTQGVRNLTPRRGPNVWDRESLQPDRDLQWRERWALGLAAAGLALGAVRRTSWPGVLTFGVAAALAARAAGGYNDLGAMRGWMSRAFCRAQPDDVVTYASEDSFPASDSPAWTVSPQPAS